MFFLSFILLFNIYAPFVSAESDGWFNSFTDQLISSSSKFGSFLTHYFSSEKVDAGSFEGSNEWLISQTLLMILVVFLVFTILDFIKIFGSKKLVLWGVSLVVGILSFIMVPASEIRLIVLQYQTLGVILTTFLPSLIILLFTWKIQEEDFKKDHTRSGISLFSFFLLFSYGVCMLIKIFYS